MTLINVRRAMPSAPARMLHVVVSDVEVDGEYEFTRRVFGSLPEALRSLAVWLVELLLDRCMSRSGGEPRK